MGYHISGDLVPGVPKRMGVPNHRDSGRYFFMPQYTDPAKQEVFLDYTIYGSGPAADNITDPDKRQVFFNATIYGSGQAAESF